MTETLKQIHEFCDGMAEKEVKHMKVSMPKWLIQGTLYGTFLAAVGYTVGAIAINAIPGFFPASYDVILGAIGFIGSVAIAYTKDITSE